MSAEARPVVLGFEDSCVVVLVDLQHHSWYKLRTHCSPRATFGHVTTLPRAPHINALSALSAQPLTIAY